jgi:hypothetical protein
MNKEIETFEHNGEILTFHSDGHVTDDAGARTEDAFPSIQAFREAAKNEYNVLWID